MSLPIQVTFLLTDWVVKGLKDGTFERVGGIIREVASKKIVTWLRDTNSVAPSVISFAANPVTGVLNLIASGANLAVSAKGFSSVNQRLDGIENQIASIGQSLQFTQGILQVSTAASILNLGVSVMGFAVISQRLNEIENQLKQSQELLNKINRKIDLSFYANFRAGIELAINAFTMTKIENRRSSALQAINRFLEAEQIYKDYTVNELSQKSQIIDKYILTLSLAYIAEARCYLELEEHETATRRFQEGTKVMRLLINKYIEIMLTSNPSAYLHPQFKGQIDLGRLTKIYKWMNPNFDENAVFDLLRENIFNLAQNNNEWLSSLPSSIVDRNEISWGLFGRNPTPLTGRFEKEAYQRLPQVFEVMESMIETNNRFESYQTEIQAISQLGISFHEWLQLKPATETRPEDAELIYIIPSQPLELKLLG